MGNGPGYKRVLFLLKTAPIYNGLGYGPGMSDGDGLGTGRTVVVIVVIALLAVAGFGLGALLSGSGSATHATPEQQQNGFTFVYHPDGTVTVVKQEVTTFGTNLTVVGPGGTVSWTNASGGSTNMTALFDLHALGANPGSQLLIKKRLDSKTVVPVANSTVPAHPRNASFVMVFHQVPMVTVVNVYPNRTNASTLELDGPKGSVAWYNATKSDTITAKTTTFTATPKSATFVYDGPKLGATAGDNVSLVRVNTATGNRTTLLTNRIP